MEIIHQQDEKNSLVRFKDKVIVTSDFTDVFNNISYGIGIREPLDEVDLDSLFSYLTRNFKLLNLSDVAIAFDLYSAQKLDFKESHFNSFDRVFIGKVLTSYETYKKAQQKLKEFRYDKPKETNKGWSMHEKKHHFEWLKGIYFEESERNGKSMSFPKVLIASFKDVYDYMINENLIKEKQGIELSKSIRSYSMSEKVREKNPFEGVVKQDLRGKIPPYFYRNEVLNYFKEI